MSVWAFVYIYILWSITFILAVAVLLLLLHTNSIEWNIVLTVIKVHAV